MVKTIGCQVAGYGRIHSVPGSPQPIDGTRIKEFREARGWSQSELKRRSGVGQDAISRLESGHVQNPRIENVQKIADALEVSLDDLLRKPAAGSAAAAAPTVEELSSEEATPSEIAVPARLTREFAREVADELAQLLASGERLPIASAGPGAPADLDFVRPHIMRIRGEAGLQRGPLVAFEVVGDCLEPRLRPGWIAWVNPEATRRPGDIVLAYVDGEEMFKQFDRDRETGAEFLTALNGRPPIPIGPNVRIEGVVQLVQHAP